MGLLRQLCIPFLTFLLQSVLSSANQLKQCLQLADIIASPKTALYEVRIKKDNSINYPGSGVSCCAVC